MDGNKEMMAVGIMSMAGCCASCYVTTGSFSRSAVNYNVGSKTAVSNTVMASAVVFMMLVLMPLFYYTPNVILGAILVTAVIGGMKSPVPNIPCPPVSNQSGPLISILCN